MGAFLVFVSQRRGDAFLRSGVLFASDSGAAKNRQIQNLYNNGMLPVCRFFEAIHIDLANKILLLETDFFDQIHTTPSGSDKIAVFRLINFKRLSAINCYIGRRTRILVPPSVESSMINSPPWARITSRAIVNPSPLPAVSGLRALSSR